MYFMDLYNWRYSPIDQFRYIKIQPQTIDLSARLWVINTEFVGFIPQSLVLRSIVWDWILIYRNWSIAWPRRLFNKSLTGINEKGYGIGAVSSSNSIISSPASSRFCSSFCKNILKLVLTWQNVIPQVAQARYMSSSLYVDLCVVTQPERLAYL